MSESDLISKLESIWSRLPKVLRWIVFGLSLFLFIEVFGALADGDQLGWPGLIAVVAVLSAATFIAIALWDMHRREPKEVVAEAELANKHSRKIFWLCVAGALTSLIMIWFTVRLLVPGDTAYQFEFSVFAGGMIAAVLAAPLLGSLMAWGIGRFMAPSWITSDYKLVVAADAHDILKNRADIERAPEFQHGISRAERLSGNDPVQYRLHPDGIIARLVRFGQKVTVIAYEPPRHLVLDTCSDGGDYERIDYRLADELSVDGRHQVVCRMMTQLQSPVIKVIAKVSGGGKMAAGGAEVEARRMRTILGCDVEVSDLTVSSHASCPDPEFIA